MSTLNKQIQSLISGGNSLSAVRNEVGGLKLKRNKPTGKWGTLKEGSLSSRTLQENNQRKTKESGR